MFYLPKIMLYSHFTFALRSLGGMLATGYEWWTTPVVVPCSKCIVCIWHLGFRWKTIKYPAIEKLVCSSILSPSLTIMLQTGKMLELGAGGGYCLRELKKIVDAILNNMCSLSGIRMKRDLVGNRCVVWTREPERNQEKPGTVP